MKNHKNTAARFILVTNIHWLLNWHRGREMWAITEMLRRSPRNHDPGRRQTADPSSESEVWWIKCAEASTNPPPASCTHQWNSFHVKGRGPAATSTNQPQDSTAWTPDGPTGLQENMLLCGLTSLWLAEGCSPIGLNRVSVPSLRWWSVGKFKSSSLLLLVGTLGTVGLQSNTVCHSSSINQYQCLNFKLYQKHFEIGLFLILKLF